MAAAHSKTIHAKMAALGPEAVAGLETELRTDALASKVQLKSGIKLTDDDAKAAVIIELALFGLRCAIASMPADFKGN